MEDFYSICKKHLLFKQEQDRGKNKYFKGSKDIKQTFLRRVNQ